jgi:hypothetical protein
MTTALPGGQEGCSMTRAPAQIWRHIAPGRRGQARDVTFKILEDIRTVARVVHPAANGGPGG